MSTNITNDMNRLVEIMALLRDPDKGCPWDVEQDFKSIAPHTIEEAYEVVDAIERDDMTMLVDELGDLLLQVVFHAQMADEHGHFDFNDVVCAICDKLVRRHPHVFADARVYSAVAQLKAWEDTKAQERRAKSGDNGNNGNNSDDNVENTSPHSVLDDVAMALPALTRAIKLQKRAARVGFDWHDTAPVIDKINEELHELEDEMAAASRRKSKGNHDRLEDEVGDLLFSVVNLARKLDVDAEKALRHGNSKFARRFHRIEELLSAAAKKPEDASVDEMETLWRQAKSENY